MPRLTLADMIDNPRGAMDAEFRQPFTGSTRPNMPPPDPKTLADMLEMAAMSQVPGLSDVASGGLALSDLIKGNYGSAALNGLGALPFIPAMIKFKSGYPSKAIEALKTADRIDHPDVRYLTPVARSGTLSGDLNATMSKLSNGNYLSTYSPVWGTGQKPFHIVGDNLDEVLDTTKSKISRADAKTQANRVYESIPGTWSGDAKKIAKALIDEGLDLGGGSFVSSARSESKYIKLPNGEKIRISGHALPLAYEGADYEFRSGDDIKSLIDKITGRTE